jgi:tetratricopeptide (TPR) repeat protein
MLFLTGRFIAMLRRIKENQIARVFSISPIFLSVFLLGLLAMWFGTLRNVDIGDEAPNFVLQDTNGRELSLISLRGKIAIIVFWKAGEKHCLEALTSLQSIYIKFQEHSVEVLALSIDKSGLELISKIKSSEQLTFPMLYDSEEKAYGDYGVVVTPSTIIIDQEGKLNYYYPGYRNDFSRQISGRVEVLLGQKTLEELQAELQPVKNPELSEAEKHARRYLNAGNRLLEKGMTKSAMLQYQKAIEEKPDLFEAHLRLGDIYLEQKKTPEAVAEFTQAIKLKPRSDEAYAGLGDALFFQDELLKAMEMLQLALKINPKLARVHYRLGRIYEEQNQIEDALKEYKIAVKILLEIEE